MEGLSGRTRTLTFPRLMSLGGFASRSRIFRFWLMAGLLFENGGSGARTTGSAARISSGSSNGSGVFPKDLGFAWGVWSAPSTMLGISAEDLSLSTDV